MPVGFELTSAERIDPDVSFHKGTAVYEISVTKDESVERLKECICRLMANDSLKLQRRMDAHGRTKTVDVREYLEDIEVVDQKVIVNARFSTQGSIRVDEILSLLEISVTNLDGPVTRTKVLWDFMLKAQN